MPAAIIFAARFGASSVNSYVPRASRFTDTRPTRTYSALRLGCRTATRRCTTSIRVDRPSQSMKHNLRRAGRAPMSHARPRALRGSFARTVHAGPSVFPTRPNLLARVTSPACREAPSRGPALDASSWPRRGKRSAWCSPAPRTGRRRPWSLRSRSSRPNRSPADHPR